MPRPPQQPQAFKGRVTRITRGGVVAEVIVDIGTGQEIVSVITNGSRHRQPTSSGVSCTRCTYARGRLLT